MQQTFIKSLIFTILLSCASPISALEIVGQQPAQIKIAQPKSTPQNNKFAATSAHSIAPPAAIKQVMLMKVHLSASEQSNLKHRLQQTCAPLTHLASSANGTSHVELGMNHVPVLDQGQHGSCVTFANSAAIDALLGKGAYISELCNLELGSYFAKNGFQYSGWDGSNGPIVLNQMMNFGVISRAKQKAGYCSISTYPADNQNDVGTPLSLADFHNASMNLNKKIYWEPIVDVFEFIDPNYNPNATLKRVKTELNKSHRITFGTLIPVEYCFTGACAKTRQSNDTWVITPAMTKDRNFSKHLAGHEMLIIGYDDNLVAHDSNGNTYRGMLHLRNSWGNKVGDNGDFYMSYRYFKYLVYEAQYIAKLPKKYLHQ